MDQPAIYALQFYILGLLFATIIISLLAYLMIRSYFKSKFKTNIYLFVGLLLTSIGIFSMLLQIFSTNIASALLFQKISTMAFTLEFIFFAIAGEYMRTLNPSLWFLCIITFFVGVMVADIFLSNPILMNIGSFWVTVKPRSGFGSFAFYTTSILVSLQFLYITYLINKFATHKKRKVIRQIYLLYVLSLAFGILGFYVSNTTGLQITPIIYAVLLSSISLLIIKNPFLISLLPTKIYELLVFREDGILIYSKEFLPGVSESFHLLVADFLSALASFAEEIFQFPSRLKEITFEDFRLVLIRGAHLYAALVADVTPRPIIDAVNTFILNLEEKFGEQLSVDVFVVPEKEELDELFEKHLGVFLP
ncbi:MAG: hypothetical protein ACP6IQ_01210 [Candidatus Njordarchaeia archaeon]